MKNIINNIKSNKVMGRVILSLLTLHLSLFTFTSCEDMMTVETGDKTYINANDTLYSYLGIMRAMQDVAERQVILGEIRGDLVSSSDYTTDTLFAISNFDNPKDQSCSMLQVSDYYNVINNCNFYIHNCDTNTIKSNIKYMIPEYVQVKAIRAWAYLQLVKNYKEVPYITEPISNLDVIKRFDYANNLVNKDNLIDKLLEDNLAQLVDTRYPQYGNPTTPYGGWSNGYTRISARICFIPIRLVLGDAYLLRGANTSDYEKAAQYYFNFLKNEKTPMAPEYTEVEQIRSNVLISSFGGWGRWAETYDYDEDDDVITVIPSSANAGFGKVLTRVADIFGHTPSSSQSSENVEAEENSSSSSASTEEVVTSGNINVTPNYKRQYGPSNAYTDVNNDQTFITYKDITTANPVASIIENTDARNYFSVEDCTYEGEAYPLCAKAAKYSAFYYTIPIYRKTLVWLRLAEAINRAGHPEFAFAILKDGLNQYSIPQIADRYSNHITTLPEGDFFSRYSINTGETIYLNIEETTNKYMHYDADGNLVEYTGEVTPAEFKWNQDTTQVINYGTVGAMYYVDSQEKINNFNSFLNFKDEVWDMTYGIHAKGCGFGNWTSARYITTNISGMRDSVYYDYSTLLQKQGVNIATASKEAIINGVENIIVDELALETAFEGNRFTDLVRIAEHKEASGFKGKEWLAKKIANRGTKKATSKTPAVDGYDASLYGKLLNSDLWYFSLPNWK